MSLRTPLLVGLFALALSLLPLSQAAAHAVLTGVVPADGARLDRPPGEVRLEFNEPVSPARVRVLDGSGAEVAGPDQVMAHGTMLHIALPDELPAGGYVASYRVISLDGHPVVGAVVFTVGTGGKAAVATVDRSISLSATATMVRAAHYLALFVAAGGGLFVLLVTGRRHPVVAGFMPVVVGAAAAVVASAVLRVGLTGAELVDGTLAGIITPAAWSVGAGASVAVSGNVAALGAVVAALALRFRGIPHAGTMLALGVATAIGALGLSGHAASAPPRWFSAPLVVAHGAAAAYWVGAFWPLAVVLRRLPAQEASSIVRRFATIAVPAVALLVAAGAVLSVLQIGSVAALTGTPYGLTWLAKLGLVCGLLALAAVNRQVLTPALVRGVRDAAARLRGSVALEGIVAIGIALATAGFALGPPPRAIPAFADTATAVAQGAHDHAAHDHAAHDHGTHRAASRPTSVIAEARGRTASIAVDPAAKGRNAIVVTVADSGGRPVVARAVRLEAALPEIGVEPIARELAANGDGTYTASDFDLPIAGRWALRIDVLVSDFEKLIFRAEFPVGE